MNTTGKGRAALKEIPSVDEVIECNSDLLINAPYLYYLNIIRNTLNKIRNDILEGKSFSNVREYSLKQVKEVIMEISTSNMKHVINGTGIILHTGLGRAPLSKELLQEAVDRVYPYSNLELELQSGKRGERTGHVELLINTLTGSESALVVNNNAAAVLIMLNTLSEGKNVIISRGEQVEIGGSFRIPDVIEKSGCNMVEVGTTNKTHLEDYQQAITKNTGAILVAHTSNYKVLGFTKSVKLTELSALAKKNRIPLILDLGSGAIADFQKLGLPHEPMVRTYLQSGASLISFSGDKLLGGPQAGIICGKKSLIQKIHNNPMYRALRCDKLTYAILEGTLRSYYTPSDIHSQNLTMALFSRKQEELEKLGMNILKKLPKKIVENYGIEAIPTDVEAGSGSLPLEKFPSTALVFSGKKASAFAQVFRKSDPPILGYITGKQFHIDLKAIPDDMISVLTDTIVKTLK